MLNLLPGKDFQMLIHEVKLKGVSDSDSFILRYPQPDGKYYFIDDTSQIVNL